MWRLVHLNPALWRGIILTGVAVLTSAGVFISPDIPNATIAFIFAALPMIQAVWTRGAVTPNAKVVVAMPDPTQPDEIVAGDAVTTATSRDIIEAAHAAGGSP